MDTCSGEEGLGRGTILCDSPEAGMGTWDTMVAERVFSLYCLLSLFLDSAPWQGTNLSERSVDSGKLAGWTDRAFEAETVNPREVLVRCEG